MAPPDAYVRPRGAALPPREGRRGPPSPSRLVAAPTAWRSRRPGSEERVDGAARRLRPPAGRGAAAEGGPPRAVAARHLLANAL